MDVVAVTAGGPGQRMSANAPTWRMLAICADARSGIENAIIDGLSGYSELRLAGLTYAVLHGMAVILLLGHQAEPRTVHDVGLAEFLSKHCAGANVVVSVDEWQSREQLGSAGPDPLLRVHIRSEDRPGALRDVLNSLGATLRRELPWLEATPAEDQIGAWYALSQVAAGHAAVTRLTVRLAVNNAPAWDCDKLDELKRKLDPIERAVRQDAARAAADARSSANPSSDELDAPEDPVISVSLIQVPAQAIESARAGAIRPITRPAR
jgi:hypothetical protein